MKNDQYLQQKFDKIWEKVTRLELVQTRDVEMFAIYKRCMEFDRPFMVEIGSAHGASSTVLAEVAKEKDSLLRCFDTYPENYYNQPLFGEYAYKQFIKNMQPYEPYCLFQRGNSSDVSLLIGYKWIDVLFIDGDHEYEGVKFDCYMLLPLLKSGGYVAFHDYNNSAFGVKKAADEFCSTWEMTDDVWDLVIFKKP